MTLCVGNIWEWKTMGPYIFPNVDHKFPTSGTYIKVPKGCYTCIITPQERVLGWYSSTSNSQPGMKHIVSGCAIVCFKITLGFLSLSPMDS